MSEIHAPRGRGSARGGRGGHTFRGGRGGARAAKSTTQENITSFEDEGELGQLKKKYSGSLPLIKELFPDWTDEDLVFALEDADGDLETAIERISEGNVSQWGEVKKKHVDRTRPKAKEAHTASDATAAPPSRGGRGRGGFEGRGRGRGDRGRGGRGGRAGAQLNGTRAETSAAPVAEFSEPAPVPVDAWGVDGAAKETSDKPAPETAKPTTESPQKSSLIPEGTKKGWASLFAKPTPPPPQKKQPPPAAAPVPEQAPEAPVEEQPIEQHLPQSEETHVEETIKPPEPALPAVPEPQLPATTTIEPKEEATQTTQEEPQAEIQTPTTTVDAGVSTADDQAQQLQQQPLQEQPPRPAVPYTPTASYKTTPGRSHFQRRLLDQQEAVVMPGNHAVDRAAVQFGSMGLNGSPEDVDIDEQREEPETRPQPPQHSPIAPRASLPPSTRAAVPGETAAPAPRAAPGLPPVPPSTAAETSFNDFNRYAEAQKPYDPFGQQVEQPQPHPQAQEPFSNQATLPSQPAVTTGADYSAFYGTDQSRNPYYYGGYGQPQELPSQRVASGFSATGTEPQVQPPTTQAPGRYGHVEASTSGQNTPNPTLPGQTQPTQPTHMPQAQGHGGFNYGYPYYSNPHYPNTYINQMGQQHQYGRNRPMYDDVRRYEDHYLQQHNNQFGYGSQYAPYGKGGMYGQPQHAFSYEHSSSPANAGAFTQGVPARDASYGRTGSAQQPTEGQQTTGSTAFGGITDVFGRAQAGFGQNQPGASQQPVTGEEVPKGYEGSKAGGPSPSVSQANRPGSAANNVPNQPAASQTGLPPVPGQQGSQQGFGNYPHLNPQYGGLGGLGTHHQTGASQTHHQGGGYGNYGAGFGSNYYGNTGRGGGWGGNYGH